MAIKKYGLDEAEVSALRNAGLSEDEINAANEKRVKAQIESDETEPLGENDQETPEEIAAMPFYGGESFPKNADINKIMPHASPAMKAFYIEHFGDSVTTSDGMQIPFLPPSYAIEMWYASHPDVEAKENFGSTEFVFNPEKFKSLSSDDESSRKVRDASRFAESVILDLVEQLNPNAGILAYNHKRLIKNI